MASGADDRRVVRVGGRDPQANAQLGSINFALGLSNAVRNHQLQVALRNGQTKLRRLQINLQEHGRTIEKLKEEVRELDEQLHDQRQVSEELRATLAQKEDDLRQSLQRVGTRPFEITAGPLQQPMQSRSLVLWVSAINSTAAS